MPHGESKSIADQELPAEIAAERDRFELFLHSRGLRLTQPRAVIFEEVFRHHGHIDAEGIAERLKKMGKKGSRATVYRTLDLLVEAGHVKPVQLGSSQSLYEHVHTGEHHDHMVCRCCGKIIEFYSEELEECQSRLCEEHVFKPERHTMVIFGECSECREKGKEKSGR